MNTGTNLFKFDAPTLASDSPLMPEGNVATLGRIHVAGPEIVITFKFNDELREAVKAELHGRRWHPNAKRKGGEWRAPLTRENEAAIKRLCAQHEFTLTADAVRLLGHDGRDIPTLTYSGKAHLYVHWSYGQGCDTIEPLFGVYDTQRSRWRVPLAPHAIVGLKALVDEGRLNPDTDAAEQIAARLPEAQRELDRYVTLRERSQAAADDLHIEGLGGTLRPYQSAGVSYALAARRCFIADQMGLGKTVQGLAALQADEAFPAVIVCPSIVKLNWLREANTWLPGRRIEVVNGTKPRSVGLFQPDVVIVNYDVLYAHAEQLAKMGVRGLVVDESHYAKNADARRTKALVEVSRSMDEDALRILLTGTPVAISPMELTSQLEVIGRMGDLGGKTYFRNRYMDENNEADNMGELNRRLRATCYVRREKKDVLTELPDKQRATVLLDVEMGAAYAHVRAETVGWLREHENDKSVTDAIRQAKLDNVRAEISLAKSDVAIKWVKDFLEGGDKLVVFAYSIATQNKLVDAFPGCVHVMGKDSPKARQAAVDAFQNDDDVKLIVCSLKAAGVGITLTAASDVAFVEMGWTSADQDQAEDRCHRLGQHDSVTAWYLLAKGTEDVDVAELIDERRKMVAAVADGKATDPSESIVTELTRRLLEGSAA